MEHDAPLGERAEQVVGGDDERLGEVEVQVPHGRLVAKQVVGRAAVAGADLEHGRARCVSDELRDLGGQGVVARRLRGDEAAFDGVAPRLADGRNVEHGGIGADDLAPDQEVARDGRCGRSARSRAARP